MLAASVMAVSAVVAMWAVMGVSAVEAVPPGQLLLFHFAQRPHLSRLLNPPSQTSHSRSTDPVASIPVSLPITSTTSNPHQSFVPNSVASHATAHNSTRSSTDLLTSLANHHIIHSNRSSAKANQSKANESEWNQMHRILNSSTERAVMATHPQATTGLEVDTSGFSSLPISETHIRQPAIERPQDENTTNAAFKAIVIISEDSMLPTTWDTPKAMPISTADSRNMTTSNETAVTLEPTPMQDSEEVVEVGDIEISYQYLKNLPLESESEDHSMESEYEEVIYVLEDERDRTGQTQTLFLDWPTEKGTETMGKGTLIFILVFAFLITMFVVLAGCILWLQVRRRRHRQYCLNDTDAIPDDTGFYSPYSPQDSTRTVWPEGPSPSFDYDPLIDGLLPLPEETDSTSLGPSPVDADTLTWTMDTDLTLPSLIPTAPTLTDSQPISVTPSTMSEHWDNISLATNSSASVDSNLFTSSGDSLTVSPLTDLPPPPLNHSPSNHPNLY